MTVKTACKVIGHDWQAEREAWSNGGAMLRDGLEGMERAIQREATYALLMASRMDERGIVALTDDIERHAALLRIHPDRINKALVEIRQYVTRDVDCCCVHLGVTDFLTDLLFTRSKIYRDRLTYDGDMARLLIAYYDTACATYTRPLPVIKRVRAS